MFSGIKGIVNFLQKLPDVQVLGTGGFALAAFHAGIGLDGEGSIVCIGTLLLLMLTDCGSR